MMIMETIETEHAIFVSDFHLEKRDRDRYEKVMRFLRGLIGKVDHLFFLGDTFEFWYGDRKAMLQEYAEVLDILKELSQTGTKSFFFEGNHDIYFGSFFLKELGATVYRQCDTLKINKFKVFLGHGDELVQGNTKYLFFRTLLRLPSVKSIMSKAPGSLVLKTALMCSRISRRLGTVKKSCLAEEYWNVASQKFQTGINVVILGHSHTPEIRKLDNGLYINCGNWINEFSFVELKGDTFSLKHFE